MIFIGKVITFNYFSIKSLLNLYNTLNNRYQLWYLHNLCDSPNHSNYWSMVFLLRCHFLRWLLARWEVRGNQSVILAENRCGCAFDHEYSASLIICLNCSPMVIATRVKRPFVAGVLRCRTPPRQIRNYFRSGDQFTETDDGDRWWWWSVYSCKNTPIRPCKNRHGNTLTVTLTAWTSSNRMWWRRKRSSSTYSTLKTLWLNTVVSSAKW